MGIAWGLSAKHGGCPRRLAILARSLRAQVAAGASIISECLRFILKPLARFCVRHKISLQEVTTVFKEELVLQAQRVLAKELQTTKRVSHSRISLLTGVHRQDVKSVVEQGESGERQAGLLTRVLGLWEQDSRFNDKKGNPKSLSCSGKKNEFETLVHSLSKDLTAGSVLQVLEETGVVKRESNKVTFLSREYVPKLDYQQSFQMLEADVNDLISCIEENTFDELTLPHLHLQTEYDQIPKAKLPELHRWLLREGTIFHRKIRNHIAEIDDYSSEAINPEQHGHISICTFSYSGAGVKDRI